MQNLFSRLYLQLLCSFLVIVMVIGLTVYGYAQQRLVGYAHQHLSAMQKIASGIWQRLDNEQQLAWLAIASTVSGTAWQSVTAKNLSIEQQVEKADIWFMHAVGLLRLDSETVVRVTIDDWQDWQTGIGWLVLSDLSSRDAALREVHLQRLKSYLPFDASRVNRSAEPLNALELRQLADGQAVRISEGTSDILYFPAGASQVIRFGPIDRFELLSPVHWVLLLLLSLLSLSLMFSLAVRPLHQRFKALYQAVGQIDDRSESVRLPTEYKDQFGELAERIERLALNFINQLETNKRLNLAVSHDLKTPLARIKFALALTDRRESDGYLEQVDRDINLLSELVSELLRYHQLAEGPAAAERCDGRDIIEQQLAGLPNRLRVEVALPEHLPVPLAAPDWRRIVSNLLNNAEQYARQALSVSCSINADEVLLVIEDDGPGMSASDFAVLRQPFQRQSTDRNLSDAHYGLGLALVDATVKHYRGAMSCQVSGRLGGAKLTVALPYKSATM